jgi:D-serine deaminase-like pyridoxal phosphate-dependent protein
MRATPYVQVDPAILRSNIESMQAFCNARGLALRPHAKTHKTLEIARLQLTAGAVGVSVATVGEAEVLADTVAEHGADVLVAYPVSVEPSRLRSLAERVSTILGVDSIAGVRRAADAGLAVSIEVDCGLRRSGVAPAQAGALAAGARALGVPVTGVFTFPGHGYGLGQARADAAADEAQALTEARAGLRAEGFEDVVTSGGCTPTAALVDAGVVTELRPGVYVFMDAGQLALGVATLDQVALTVQATVTSDAVPGQVVLDCGAKLLGMDRPAFLGPRHDAHGFVPAYPGTRLARIWEHHGVLEVPPGVDGPQLGERVDVVPNHVCATVNLVDELVVGDDVWAVAARGRNT